jgi:hypothetical protein
MTKQTKLLASIRNNPNAVRFEDACKTAELIGFVKKRVNGSHHLYAKPNEPLILNFQNRNGYVHPYQVSQLVKMLEKYEV